MQGLFRKAETESERQNRLGVATMTQVIALSKETAEIAYNMKGPDEYTAGVYAYAIQASGLYLQDLSYGSYELMNRTLREALSPLLMTEEFEWAAWYSMQNTGASWLVADWVRRLDRVEADYILNWAKTVFRMPDEEAEFIDEMMQDFFETAERDPEQLFQKVVNTIIRSATDGEFDLFKYETGQNAEVPARAWADAVARLEGVMNEDGFASRHEAEMVRAAHAQNAT